MQIIRVKSGALQGHTCEVGREMVTLGRDPSQTIQIEDNGVSRAHAQIFRIGELCFIRDLGSTNGSFLNDVRVTEEPLRHGDEVMIGNTILVFEDATAAKDPLTLDLTGEAGRAGDTIEIRADAPDSRKPHPLDREVQSRNLTLINQVGRALRGGQDPEGICKTVLDIICRAIGANQGYFFRLERGTDRFDPDRVIEADASGGEKKVSRTIVARVLQNGMPLLSADAALDGRFAFSESVILRQIRSVICVPVMVGDTPGGILYFHSNTSQKTFGVEDLELVSSVALQLSVVLAPARGSGRWERTLQETVRALVTAIEAVDSGDRGRANRVAVCGAMIADRMGLSPEVTRKVHLAGLLHDVGRIGVRRSPAGISAEALKRQHVAAAESILEGIEDFGEVLAGIRYHHERADGSGYPYRITNAEMPVVARIVIVAVELDDLLFAGTPLPDAVEDLSRREGKEFDKQVVQALVQSERAGDLQELVS